MTKFFRQNKSDYDEAYSQQRETPVPAVNTGRKQELDLHGKTVHEAIELVDRFLEQSYNSGEYRVWIIHGRGTGILRKAVREQLKKHSLVRSFITADGGHGGEGAVMVTLAD